MMSKESENSGQIDSQGWVKSWRKIEKWQWYTAPNMAHLFQHLVRKANHKDGFWRGHPVKKGQLITSLKHLSQQTGISMQSLRTCLERLKSTREITRKATSHFTLITILNYNLYQSDDDDANTTSNTTSNIPLTNHQHATNTPPTTNKNNKNKENDKNSRTKQKQPTKPTNLPEIPTAQQSTINPTGNLGFKNLPLFLFSWLDAVRRILPNPTKAEITFAKQIGTLLYQLNDHANVETVLQLASDAKTKRTPYAYWRTALTEQGFRPAQKTQ